MDLHSAIGFTRAFATDGSKEGKRDGRTAYGIWEGCDVLAHGATEVEGEQWLHMPTGVEEKATGGGMEGGRLPRTWEVIDAETYAVLRALLRTYLEARRRGGDEEAKKRKSAHTDRLPERDHENRNSVEKERGEI